MRNEQREEAAERAASHVRTAFGLTPDNAPATAIVLGRYWGDALPFEKTASIESPMIPGLESLVQTKDQTRRLSYGKLDGVPVLTLQGRAHLHDSPYDAEHLKMMRLLIDLQPQLGAKTVILTCTVGDLGRRFGLGDIAIINGFLHGNVSVMPYWLGDSKTFPDQVLTKELREIALREADDREGRRSAKEAVYAMMHGPHIEGEKDKTYMERAGADVVGMSLLPEACVLALYPEVRVLGLGIVTNDKQRDAFMNHKSKEQRFEEDQRRVREVAKTLGPYLSRIVARISPPPVPSSDPSA